MVSGWQPHSGWADVTHGFSRGWAMLPPIDPIGVAHSGKASMRSLHKAEYACHANPTAEAAGYLSGAFSRLFLAVMSAAMRPCGG